MNCEKFNMVVRLFVVSILVCILPLSGQVPTYLGYQGVARAANGQAVSSQQVGIRISIIQDSVNGLVIYSETHQSVTNANGLFSLSIGGGSILSGDFSTIDWGYSQLYNKVEIDPNGGTNYLQTTLNPFVSVPYSNHSEKTNASANDAPQNSSTPSLLYHNGISWGELPLGKNGQRLRVCGDSLVWTYGFCPPAAGWNPLNAYVDTNSIGQGCVVCDAYSVGDSFSLDEGISFLTVVDRALLGQMRSNGDDLSKVCVSLITDMSSAFLNDSSFNDDISSWDVSNVTNMSSMFEGAVSFNSDVSNWNTGKVRDLRKLFKNASVFNQDLNSWDVSKVNIMLGTFSGATSFNMPLDNWNTHRVRNMVSMFEGAASFNQPIGSWNTAALATMKKMFNGANTFNQDLSNWNTAQVTDFSRAFLEASSFNGDISTWNVESGENFSYMFFKAVAFGGDLSTWRTYSASNMTSMFYKATVFDSDLSDWCVSTIATAPNDFDVQSSLDSTDLPVWGSCECFFNVFTFESYEVDSTFAQLISEMIDDGGDTSFVRGFQLSQFESFPDTSTLELISTSVAFGLDSMSAAGLIENTHYYLRGFARGNKGECYGAVRHLIPRNHKEWTLPNLGIDPLPPWAWKHAVLNDETKTLMITEAP